MFTHLELFSPLEDPPRIPSHRDYFCHDGPRLGNKNSEQEAEFLFQESRTVLSFGVPDRTASANAYFSELRLCQFCAVRS